jgi:hypothetical protein
MRWALLLRYKRLIFSNEMKSSSDLSGNMMKKVSSGGDELIGRTHGKEETSFVPHFLCFCMANDIPKIAPFDNAINNRLNIISYNKRFVAEPSNEFELKLDENLDNEMKSDKFKIHFGYLMTNAYYKFIENNKLEVIPDGVKNAKSEWVGDDADNLTINKFLEDYEITNDIVDYTTNKDIEEWIKDNKINISIIKFVMELKKYCIIKKHDHIESKVKKIAGKCHKGWIGIKLRLVDDVNQLDS